MELQPLSWSDLWSWSRLTQRVLDPTDVDAIRKIDQAYCAHERDEAAKRRARLNKGAK